MYQNLVFLTGLPLEKEKRKGVLEGFIKNLDLFFQFAVFEKKKGAFENSFVCTCFTRLRIMCFKGIYNSHGTSFKSIRHD